MLLEKNQRLVMIGDSVTDCGRARPVGEGNTALYGSGYPALVNSMIDAKYPSLHIRCTNMGVSGDNALSLKARWKTDVIDLRPDWVTIMIGINDIWRQFDLPKQPETHVYPDTYEETLRYLVNETKPVARGIVLVTPVFMDTNKSDPMRAMRDQYAEIMKKVALETGARLCDPQPAFDEYFKHYHPMCMSWDYVHPNLTGHYMIASEILKTLEY